MVQWKLSIRISWEYPISRRLPQNRTFTFTFHFFLKKGGGYKLVSGASPYLEGEQDLSEVSDALSKKPGGGS